MIKMIEMSRTNRAAMFAIIAFGIVLSADVAYAQTCNVNQMRVSLRRSLLEYYSNPAASSLTAKQIKDLLRLYLSVQKGQTTVDCSGVGASSNTVIGNIVNQARSLNNSIPACNDGTPYGTCSADRPKYCYAGKMVSKCDVCGCPAGYVCQSSDKKCVPSSAQETSTSSTTQTTPASSTTTSAAAAIPNISTSTTTSAIKSNVTNATITCSDSDGGHNPTTKGMVSGIYNGRPYNYSDGCVSGTYLMEYYCSGSVARNYTYPCANISASHICSNGACISSANATTTTTTAPTSAIAVNCTCGGGDVYGNYGTVTGVVGWCLNNTVTYTNYCIDNKTIAYAGCYGGSWNGTAWTIPNTPHLASFACPWKCQNGICQKECTADNNCQTGYRCANDHCTPTGQEPQCQDLHNTTPYSDSAGYCLDVNGKHYNYCSGSTSYAYYCYSVWNGTNFLENYCKAGGFVCPGGCSNGACNPNPVTTTMYVPPSQTFCINFDENYTNPSFIYVRANCTDSNGAHWDYCNGATLMDYYCGGAWNGVQWLWRNCSAGGYVCSNGCSNGACIMSTTTTTTTTVPTSTTAPPATTTTTVAPSCGSGYHCPTGDPACIGNMLGGYTFRCNQTKNSYDPNGRYYCICDINCRVHSKDEYGCVNGASIQLGANVLCYQSMGLPMCLTQCGSDQACHWSEPGGYEFKCNETKAGYSSSGTHYCVCDNKCTTHFREEYGCENGAGVELGTSVVRDSFIGRKVCLTQCGSNPICHGSDPGGYNYRCNADGTQNFASGSYWCSCDSACQVVVATNTTYTGSLVAAYALLNQPPSFLMTMFVFQMFPGLQPTQLQMFLGSAMR